MIYVLFVIGLILFFYGFNKTRRIDKDFNLFYHEASDKEEIKFVNHTLKEEALKEDIDTLYLEIEKLKREMSINNVVLPEENHTQPSNKEKVQVPISYEALSEKLKNYDENTSLEELSREMNIGKGELLFLKNLSKK